MKQRVWIEISISNISDQTKDEIINIADDFNCVGCWEDEKALKCYFEKDDEENVVKFIRLIQVMQKENPNLEILIKEIPDKDWNELWEQSIEPIEVGEKIVIKPTWKEYPKPNKIVIQIDPKMSFGTGHHETTRLMLRAIEKYLYKSCKVLDVGTGSGILAIASIKLGAETAIGVDNDRWAYENAIENAQINNVEEKFKVILGSIDDVSEKDFDFILANINKNAIINMMEKFYNKLKQKGFLITSGYLDLEEGTIEEHLQINGFEIIDVLRENEWVATVARK